MNDELDEDELGFNPCFNGSYSYTDKKSPRSATTSIRFNPCFNGSYSYTLDYCYHNPGYTMFQSLF